MNVQQIMEDVMLMQNVKILQEVFLAHVIKVILEMDSFVLVDFFLPLKNLIIFSNRWL